MDAKNVMEQAWTQNTASAHFVIAMWGVGDILCHVFRSCLTLNEMGYWSSLDVLKQSSFILIRNTLLRRFQKYFCIKESTELVGIGFKNGQILHRSGSLTCVSYKLQRFHSSGTLEWLRFALLWLALCVLCSNPFSHSIFHRIITES